MPLKGKRPEKSGKRRAKCLWFGRSGVGKTWLSLAFKDCYYLDTEGGAREPEYVDRLIASGALYVGPADGAGSIATVVDEIRQLATTAHDRKTVIIDSFTKLFQNAIAEEEERLTAANIPIAYGIEKKPAVKMSRRLIRWIDKLDMNCIIICHEKAEWGETGKIGETFDGWDKLAYELDLVVQVVKNGPERKGFVVKSRLAEFPDGSNFDWDYDAFLSRYGTDLEDESTPLEPSSTDDVARLEQLLSVCKVPEKTLAGWKDKAGVEHWSEMESTTIQKCIKYLEGLL